MPLDDDPASRPPARTGAWPLVGRDAELRVAAATLARAPLPRGVGLVGPAGTGKTHLAREIVARARRAGSPARWFAATATGRSIPLGAFALAVRDVRATSPSRLLSEAADAILGDAAEVVVAVDDVHHLDETSAVLVHQLAGSGRARLVLTARDGEPLHEAVARLWGDGYVERVEVGPLDPNALLKLLQDTLGGRVEQRSSARLWDLTRGNLLYVHDLVESEIAAGRFAREGEVWRWRGQPVLSAGLVEAVGAHLRALPGDQRAVLDLLALADQLPLDVVAGLAGPDQVEALEGRGVVRAERDGGAVSLQLAHPLYGEVWRAGIGVVRAARLRATIAQALGDDELMLRCVLLAESHTEVDPMVLLAGARAAAVRFDLALAERLARASLRHGGGFAAQLVVTAATVATAETERSIAELARLEELARTNEEVAHASTELVTHLAWSAGLPDEAFAAIDRGRARLGPDSAPARLLGVRALLEAQLGRPDAARRDVAAVLAEPAPALDDALFAHAAEVVAGATTGRDATADAPVHGALAAAAQVPELAFMLFPTTTYRVLGLLLAGYPSRATALADELSRTAQVDEFASTALAPTVRGVAALAEGRLPDAIELLDDAEPVLARYGASAGGFHYVCLIHLTNALALAGRVAQARDVATRMTQARHAGVGAIRTGERLAWAAVAASEGALSEARELAQQAARAARDDGLFAWEVVALQVCVAYGDASPAARLEALALEVEGPRAPATAAHARALAAHDGAGLDAASATWEQLGDLVAAADAAAHAVDAHRRAGRRGSATVAAARTLRLAAACGGLHRPSVDAAARPLPLSGREREIAALVGAGLTNQQIAERLVVSVRTVEGHVYRACGRLGVASRTDLAAAVGESPIA